MKFTKLIFLAAAIALAPGCKKYLDINTDPATPQNAESRTLTPPLFAQMERGIQYDSRYMAGIVQYWGGSGNVGETHGYIPSSDGAGEIWRTNYYGLGNNLNLIINTSTAKEEWNYVGMAQALKAWSWQVTTDYHGEIVLKQAYEPNRYSFDYDSQEDVYAEVVRLANEAITNLSRTDGKGTVEKLKSADLVYAGDNAKWIKFCYGVLARNAGNLINKSTYNPAKVIEYCDKALATNLDNFMVPNAGTTAVNANFYGPLRENMGAYRPGRMIVNAMDGTYLTGTSASVLDPRLPNMMVASADGKYRFITPGGSDGGSASAKTLVYNVWGSLPAIKPGANNGRYIFNDASPFPIMTATEMQFIKAEAAFRMGDKALAHSAYLAGINTSMEFVSSFGTAISPEARATYLASASVKQSGGDLTLKDIMLQKLIALYGYGFLETWTDLRKYNYNTGDVAGNNPYGDSYVFPTTFFADNGGKPAQRFRPRYNSEYLWNAAALKALGADQIDYHTKKMWFSLP